MAGRTAVGLLALSTATVLLLFAWEGTSGFSLWDEGYLWYGAQRVALGEVPMRDFMSYDPGRYYWAAAGMAAWGDHGILALRASLAAYQVVGLFAGLWLLAATVGQGVAAGGPGPLERLLLWGVAAAILALWMLPRHKLFDIGTCLVLAAAFTAWLRRPEPARFFIAGACIGLAAVFGRNHGVYGLVAGLGAIAWLAWRPAAPLQLGRGVLAWCAGIAVGYLPVLVMFALVPGFAPAFIDSIAVLFEQGATNIPLPMPWPWTAEGTGLDFAGRVMTGLFFMVLPLAGLAALAWAVLARLSGRTVPPALVACAALSLPYSHVAFSRADLSHLAQGIFPVLLMALVAVAGLTSRLRRTALLALAAGSVVTTLPAHPGWQCRVRDACVPVDVSGARLRADPAVVADIALLRRLEREHAPGGQPFLAVPFWPGAYALLGRKAPVWEIFALFPRSQAFEQAEIARLREANPGFVVVNETGLDGREALSFRRTHPRTARFIEARFERVPDARFPTYGIYRRRPE